MKSSAFLMLVQAHSDLRQRYNQPMAHPEDLPRILQRIEHFRSLNLEQIQSIIASGTIRSIEEGATLFHEEEPCAGMFVLLEGQIHLHKIGPDGNFTIMRVLHPVYMFNEVAALDGGPNPATAVASANSTVWQISREALLEILLQFPRVGLALLTFLAAHNRHLVSQYQDLTTRPVIARCAKLLYELSGGGRNPVIRRQHPSYQMAAQIATVPELFSRTLKSLKEAGAVEVTSSEITITNAKLLAGLARIPHKP